MNRLREIGWVILGGVGVLITFIIAGLFFLFGVHFFNVWNCNRVDGQHWSYFQDTCLPEIIDGKLWEEVRAESRR